MRRILLTLLVGLALVAGVSTTAAAAPTPNAAIAENVPFYNIGRTYGVTLRTYLGFEYVLAAGDGPLDARSVYNPAGVCTQIYRSEYGIWSYRFTITTNQWWTPGVVDTYAVARIAC